MVIETYGTDGRMLAAARRMEALARDETFLPARLWERILLLPVPSFSGDSDRVRGTDVPRACVFPGAGALTVGYGFSTPRAGVLDLSKDETYLSENARLTALGTLGTLLCEWQKSPADLSIGIIGFGRIGKALTALLAPLGAALRVYSSREEVVHELGALGIGAVRLSGTVRPQDTAGLDLLINTAPAPLLAGAPDLPVYELASGDNLPAGTKARRLPGIPGKMYPESAGEAVVRAVLRRAEAERGVGV